MASSSANDAPPGGVPIEIHRAAHQRACERPTPRRSHEHITCAAISLELRRGCTEPAPHEALTQHKLTVRGMKRLTYRIQNLMRFSPVIVGTAGHIDHGKTSLVKALTGIDADRLKEEKARGITIDLGFAYKPWPMAACWVSWTCRARTAGAQHAGRRHRHRPCPARGGGRRRPDAADARAPGHPGPAGPVAWRRGADQVRPGDTGTPGRSAGRESGPCCRALGPGRRTGVRRLQHHRPGPG
jgi:hypothetical protein